MHGKPTTPALLFAIFALLYPLASQAADAWIEIKSPNFIVLSNTSDRRARDIAWQLQAFEPRSWPAFRGHARAGLAGAGDSRPKTSTMKALAHGSWEQRGSIHPDSVSGGTDRYYIALRAHVERRQSGQRQSLLLLVLDV